MVTDAVTSCQKLRNCRVESSSDCSLRESSSSPSELSISVLSSSGSSETYDTPSLMDKFVLLKIGSL